MWTYSPAVYIAVLFASSASCNWNFETILTNLTSVISVLSWAFQLPSGHAGALFFLPRVLHSMETKMGMGILNDNTVAVLSAILNDLINYLRVS